MFSSDNTKTGKTYVTLEECSLAGYVSRSRSVGGRDLLLNFKYKIDKMAFQSGHVGSIMVHLSDREPSVEHPDVYSSPEQFIESVLSYNENMRDLNKNSKTKAYGKPSSMTYDLQHQNFSVTFSLMNPYCNIYNNDVRDFEKELREAGCNTTLDQKLTEGKYYGLRWSTCLIEVEAGTASDSTTETTEMTEGEAPLYSGDFFDLGFPEEVTEMDSSREKPEHAPRAVTMFMPKAGGPTSSPGYGSGGSATSDGISAGGTTVTDGGGTDDAAASGGIKSAIDSGGGGMTTIPVGGIDSSPTLTSTVTTRSDLTMPASAMAMDATRQFVDPGMTTSTGTGPLRTAVTVGTGLSFAYGDALEITAQRDQGSVASGWSATGNAPAVNLASNNFSTTRGIRVAAQLAPGDVFARTCVESRRYEKVCQVIRLKASALRNLSKIYASIFVHDPWDQVLQASTHLIPLDKLIDQANIPRRPPIISACVSGRPGVIGLSVKQVDSVSNGVAIYAREIRTDGFPIPSLWKLIYEGHLRCSQQSLEVDYTAAGAGPIIFRALPVFQRPSGKFRSGCFSSVVAQAPSRPGQRIRAQLFFSSMSTVIRTTEIIVTAVNIHPCVAVSLMMGNRTRNEEIKEITYKGVREVTQPWSKEMSWVLPRVWEFIPPGEEQYLTCRLHFSDGTSWTSYGGISLYDNRIDEAPSIRVARHNVLSGRGAGKMNVSFDIKIGSTKGISKGDSLSYEGELDGPDGLMAETCIGEIKGPPGKKGGDCGVPDGVIYDPTGPAISTETVTAMYVKRHNFNTGEEKDFGIQVYNAAKPWVDLTATAGGEYGYVFEVAQINKALYNYAKLQKGNDAIGLKAGVALEIEKRNRDLGVTQTRDVAVAPTAAAGKSLTGLSKLRRDDPTNPVKVLGVDRFGVLPDFARMSDKELEESSRTGSQTFQRVMARKPNPKIKNLTCETLGNNDHLLTWYPDKGADVQQFDYFTCLFEAHGTTSPLTSCHPLLDNGRYQIVITQAKYFPGRCQFIVKPEFINGAPGGKGLRVSTIIEPLETHTIVVTEGLSENLTRQLSGDGPNPRLKC